MSNIIMGLFMIVCDMLLLRRIKGNLVKYCLQYIQYYAV
jgi:uncharacterized protein (DUF983 family)